MAKRCTQDGARLEYCYLAEGTGYRCPACGWERIKRRYRRMGKSIGDAMAKATKGLKRVGEYNPGSEWENRPKLEMETALGVELVLEGVAERSGENGPFLVIGVRTVADTPEEFVLYCGGLVVLKKLRQVEEAKGFPAVGVFTQHPSEIKGRTGYYDIA